MQTLEQKQLEGQSNSLLLYVKPNGQCDRLDLTRFTLLSDIYTTDKLLLKIYPNDLEYNNEPILCNVYGYSSLNFGSKVSCHIAIARWEEWEYTDVSNTGYLIYGGDYGLIYEPVDEKYSELFIDDDQTPIFFIHLENKDDIDKEAIDYLYTV